MKYLVILILILPFLTTSQSIGLTYLTELSYGDQDIQYSINMTERGSNLEITSIIRNDYSVLATSILDSSGHVIFQELGDTLISRAMRWFNLNESMLILSKGQATNDLNFSLIDGNNIINSINRQIFSDDISSFNIEGSTSNDDFIVITGEVWDHLGYKNYIAWIDNESFDVIKLEYAENNITSIGELTSVGDKIIGIAIDIDKKWHLTEFSLSHNMTHLLEVYEGNGPGNILYDKMEIITDSSDNGVIILNYSEYDYKQYLQKYKDGNLIWSTDSLLIINGYLTNFQMYSTKDRGTLTITQASIGDDIERGSYYTPVVSFYDSLGQIQWSKVFKRFNNDDSSLYDAHGFDFLETEDYYILSGIQVFSVGVQRPIILKIDKNGCLLPECGPMQVLGYHPKPKTIISSRHVWHVYNTETQERYRYTWIDKYLAYIGGTLLRSDEMSGDNWYTVRGNYISGLDAMSRKSTIPHDIVGNDYEYHFGLEDGETNSHYYPPEFLNIKQEVTQTGFTEFLDGRQMRQLEVMCTLDGEEMEEFDRRTWIDLVGDPNDIFNTANACVDPGHDVVTCFYTEGELTWSHPVYGEQCSVISTIEKERLATNAYVYPNPSSEYINTSQPYEDIRIVNANGVRIPIANGPIAKGESINVSSLASGLYYIYDFAAPRESVVTFYKN